MNRPHLYQPKPSALSVHNQFRQNQQKKKMNIFYWKLIPLRAAGSGNHPDSGLAEDGKPSAKKALDQLEGSIVSNSRNF